MSTVTNVLVHDVRCPACQRRIGVSGTPKFGIYCDEICVQDIPATEQEGRDAVIEALARDLDASRASIAERFKISRQRVYQLLYQRDLRNPPK